MVTIKRKMLQTTVRLLLTVVNAITLCACYARQSTGFFYRERTFVLSSAYQVSALIAVKRLA